MAGDGPEGGADGEFERVVGSLTAFSSTRRELSRVFARSVRMHITDADAIVLIIDAEQRGRPLTPARLAERVGLSPGATSILLGRLEEAGHIERVREGPDRRKVMLRSTAAINDSADAFFEPLRRQLGRALGEFSSSELEVVARVGDALRAVMETYLGAEHPSPD